MYRVGSNRGVSRVRKAASEAVTLNGGLGIDPMELSLATFIGIQTPAVSTVSRLSKVGLWILTSRKADLVRWISDPSLW